MFLYPFINFMDFTLSTGAAALIPVVMVLVSLSKNYLDSKWSPLVALGLCLVVSLFLPTISTGDIVGNIFQGIIMALTAMGAYSGGKMTAKAITG